MHATTVMIIAVYNYRCFSQCCISWDDCVNRRYYWSLTCGKISLTRSLPSTRCSLLVSTSWMYYLQCVYLATTTTYLCVEYCACSAGLDPAIGELCNDRSEESVQCAWSTISCNGLKSGFLHTCICAALYIEDYHCVCEMYGPTRTYVNMTMLLTCMCIFICKQVH